MRAVQESVARSRQAALEKKNARLEQETLKRQAQDRIDALRLQKERCLQARADLMKEIDLAHEQEALTFLEEIRTDPEMLISHDRYGSTLLHEACSRGMKQLASAVLSAAEEVGEATQEKLAEKLFQRDYRGQTSLPRGRHAQLCKNSDSEDSYEGSTDVEDQSEAGLTGDDYDPPPVRILLLAFMFMFQGYGAMVGNPQHALKHKLGITHDQAADFQEATATFQLAKMVMRICQIAFLVFTNPAGIVYTSYVVMFAALMVPMIFVWGAGVTGLWVVRLQYILGGVAVGLFEGTFLSVISSLGKNTKTFAIMGAPLGFFVNNTILGLLSQVGMPVIFYYIYNAACLPLAMWIFHAKRPREVVAAKSKGKGCAVFLNSMKCFMDWVPMMIPWFVAKFIGNFVLEDGFPLLFNTFNTEKVPIIGGPESEDHLIPFGIYTALIWFPCMAAGDTISRRVPQFLDITSKRKCVLYLAFGIFLSVAGEALDFLLLALVTALAAFIANFGNGFIYGLSAKFIDWGIAEEHRYAAYNLWCFVGDVGGYAGQGQLSVMLADSVCDGRHYAWVCATMRRCMSMDDGTLMNQFFASLFAHAVACCSTALSVGEACGWVLSIAGKSGLREYEHGLHLKHVVDAVRHRLPSLNSRTSKSLQISQELRLRRQSSFRNFLEEAAVVAADKPREQVHAMSLTTSTGLLEPPRQEDEASDCETDPGMPELQPVTPRAVAEVPSSQPATGDFSPSGAADDSPDRLGDSGGDFNKCWGRSALKDALKGRQSG
ncbi:mycA [Symbiodinium natans]|uniref:MycA protein n=1 Tax=Symbiodinium natans TaxID=878477 RepID=A0A812LMQ3_9DINO|nr:mycA [Symbiodinium natans]